MRRLPLILVVLFGAVLLLAGALWLFRLPLADWALAQALEAQGLNGSARFVRLGLNEAELRDLAVEDQRVGRVTLTYDPVALIRSGSLQSAEVEEATLSADLTAERPLGALQEAFAGADPGGESRPALPVLPRVALLDIELELETARGPLRLALSGHLEETDSAPDPARQVALELKTLEGPIRLGGRLEGLYRPGGGQGSNLALQLESLEGPPVSVEAEARIDGPADQPTASLSLRVAGDAPLLASLAALPGSTVPQNGRLEANLQAEASATPLLKGDFGALWSDPDGLRRADLDLAVDDLALPDRVDGLDLTGALTLEDEDGARRLRLLPAEAAVAAVNAGWLESLGLPAALAAALAEGGAVKLAAALPDDAPAALRLDIERPELRIALGASIAPQAGGEITATLDGELSLPRASPRAATSGRLTGTLAAQELDLPRLGKLARAETAFALEFAEDGGEAWLTAPLSVEGLVPAPRAVAPLADGWQPLLDRPLALTLGRTDGQSGRAVLKDGKLRITLPSDLQATAGDASLRAQLDGTLALSSSDGTILGSDLTLASLAAENLSTPYGRVASLALSGRLSGSATRADGQVRAEFDLADLAIEGAAAVDITGTLPLAMTWDDGRLTLDLTEPGRIVLSDFAEPVAPLVDRLELAPDRAILVADQANLQIQAESPLAPAQLDLDGSGRKDDLTLSAGRLAADLTVDEAGVLSGTVRSEGLDIVATESALALRGATVSSTIEAATRHIELSGARLTSTAEPALFAPLTASGSADMQGQSLRYRARATGLYGALSLDVDGDYDLDAGRGGAAVTLAPLTFEAGGLQPADISPRLVPIEKATGGLSARATVDLGRGIDGRGRVTLDGLGFTVAGTQVRGLNLSLALASLMPPTSQPGQPFSIARVDAGVPVTDVEGTLHLENTDGNTQVVVERARAAFLDGELAFEEATFDPAAERYDLTLLVRQIDLERLIALAGLEEVSGRGRLSGEIPISVDDGTIVIREGALDAQSPGVIAFKSEAARQALASGGQSVELMLRALEDFHYEVLRLTLDKPAEGDSRVFLKLEGKNPAVLDGQPFVLNINLTSNAAPLLAALARGTEISDRLVEELLRGQQP